MNPSSIEYLTTTIAKRNEDPRQGGSLSGAVYGLIGDISQLPIETRYKTGAVGITLVACEKGVFILSDNALPTPVLMRILSFFDNTPTGHWTEQWAVFIPKSNIKEVTRLQIPMSQGGVLFKYQRDDGSLAEFSLNARKGNLTEFFAGLS